MPRKSNQLAKKRLDKYYRLAKDEGYKSRAAFKLIQINREFNFLSSCNCLIDLCAAPGGWTQVASKLMPLSSLIVSVDINKMKGVAGAHVILGDITTQKCKFEIKKHLYGKMADAIIHDGSPDITGKWSKDAYAQCELTLSALKLATHFLTQGGIFVTKIFRSADYNAILWAIQQLFENVTSFKPMASRQSSAEIYLVCRNYLAPKKIDPRLLDSNFLFREIAQPKESVSVMRMRKKKKNAKPSRVGYEQDGLLYKTANIKQFLESKAPETILGEFHSFVFDENNPGDQLIKEHTFTDIEVKHLLSDLQVLNKSDFRRLLRWRIKIGKYLLSLTTNASTNDETTVEGDTTKERDLNTMEDEELEADVREMFNRKKRERRKISRKIRQAKIKRTRTMLMGGIKPDDIWDIGEREQQGLFQLKQFGDAEQLKDFMSGHTIVVPNLNPHYRKPKIKTFVDICADSDEELELQEDRLNDLYAKYKKKAGIRSLKEERQLIKTGIHLHSDEEFDDVDEEEEDGDEDGVNDNNNASVSAFVDDADEYDGDSEEMDDEMEDEIENGNNKNNPSSLLLNSDDFVIKEDSKQKKANRWFSSDIFDDIETNEAIEQTQMRTDFADIIDDEGDAVQPKKTTKSPKKHNKPRTANGSHTKKTENANSSNTTKTGTETGTKAKAKPFKYRDLPDILKIPYKVRRKMKKMTRDHRRRLKRDAEKMEERDCLFKEVPRTAMNDNDFSSDSEAIAETLAIGKQMLTNKKARMNIINNSYNRWSFNNMEETDTDANADSDDADNMRVDATATDNENDNENGNAGDARNRNGNGMSNRQRKRQRNNSSHNNRSLPAWFLEDEQENYPRNLPVTKEEVREYKAQLKAINARPIKKVAEAKARKKLRAQRIWNKMKRKATMIANSTDISERSKMKQIQKLYGNGKNVSNRQKPKSLMVASRGRKPRPVSGKRPDRGSVKVIVDRRLKADKMGRRHAGKRRVANKIKKSNRRQRNSKNKRRGR